MPKGESGIVKPDETWSQRMLKDVMTGACRGGAWELYQFFCRNRF